MSSERALGRAFFMLAVAAAGISTAAVSEVRPRLSAFAMLETGLWQLRTGSEPPRSICVSDPLSLIQLRHRATACTQFVIANEKSVATVHYSCPGAGWGRTTLRVETPRLARVDTQGIAANEPFAFTAEARRVGPCTGGTDARR
jgi:hypothetical protein